MGFADSRINSGVRLRCSVASLKVEVTSGICI